MSKSNQQYFRVLGQLTAEISSDTHPSIHPDESVLLSKEKKPTRFLLKFLISSVYNFEGKLQYICICTSFLLYPRSIWGFATFTAAFAMILVLFDFEPFESECDCSLNCYDSFKCSLNSVNSIRKFLVGVL